MLCDIMQGDVRSWLVLKVNPPVIFFTSVIVTTSAGVMWYGVMCHDVMRCDVM